MEQTQRGARARVGCVGRPRSVGAGRALDAETSFSPMASLPICLLSSLQGQVGRGSEGRFLRCPWLKPAPPPAWTQGSFPVHTPRHVPPLCPRGPFRGTQSVPWGDAGVSQACSRGIESSPPGRPDSVCGLAQNEHLLCDGRSHSRVLLMYVYVKVHARTSLKLTGTSEMEPWE